MWHILVSKLLNVHVMTMLSPGHRSPERLQTSLWRSWITPFCFFETTIMTIFPSKYSFQSQFSLPPLSYPNVASVGNYHYVFIQGQPTEEAVVLELAVWVCWLRRGTAGRRDGGRDGRLLRSPIHVSRRGHTWVGPYCDGDLPVTMRLTQSSSIWGSAELLSFHVCCPLLLDSMFICCILFILSIKF